MNLAVVISGAVIAALLLGIGGYLLLFPTPPLTLTHQVSASPKSIRTPGNLIATFSSTSNRQAPVTLEYTLLSKAGRTITSGRREITITGFESETINIPIANATPPGPYWLRSRITSGDTYAIALTGIIILAPPPPPRPRPAPQTNTSTPSKEPNIEPVTPPAIPTLPSPPTARKPENTTSPPPVVTPPVGSQGSTIDGASAEETITKARTLAATDGAKADELCMPLATVDQDNCHGEVALASKSGSYCTRISDTPSKDACYANLALIGDFSVCGDITNPDIKDSCFSLKGK